MESSKHYSFIQKNSRNKSVNYRPVSLTSVICKLLETIIRDHMMDFLVKHKLINTSQHGFLKARSCLTNLLCFFEEITKWVDDGSPVDVIYLYFQKAFDKVPHQRLILKLKSHGMGNSIINWIEQWLTDRRQRVVVDGEVSSWKSVLSGVPQGSVLGPILFLVYINDLEEGVTGNILKFADDTKLFTKTKETGDKQNLQDDIDKLVKWSEKWQMLFNFGKCKCLHIGPGNTSMNYEMGGTILSTTTSKYSHICRLQPGTQAIDILASTPPSTWHRPRGRPPLRWAYQIVNDTQLSLSDAVTATQDRTSWRSLVRDATRPATQAT